jgi:hypothetical protein
LPLLVIQLQEALLHEEITELVIEEEVEAAVEGKVRVQPVPETAPA